LLFTRLKALNHYLGKVNEHVEELDSAIAKEVSKPVTINDLMYWFALDAMGEFGFNKRFHMLRDQKWSEAALHLRSAMALLGPFSPAIWIPRIAFDFVPNVWRVKHWFQMLDFADECIQARMKVNMYPLHPSEYTSLLTLQRRTMMGKISPRHSSRCTKRLEKARTISDCSVGTL
jgi:hypothetical protein